MTTDFQDLRQALADLEIDGWRPGIQDVVRAAFGASEMPGFERESLDGHRRVGLYIEAPADVWITFVIVDQTEAAVEIQLGDEGRGLIVEAVEALMKGQYTLRSRPFGTGRLVFDARELRHIRFDLGSRKRR